MKSKNIIEITDFTQKELSHLLQRTLYFKKHEKKIFSFLKNKRVGLLFDSASLRTKLTFEIATHKLGGFPYFVDINAITHEDGIARESYEDIVDTLDKFVDVYVVRDYSQNILNVLKRKTSPPIINGFSITGHPSQALADLSTILYKKKTLETLQICTVCPSNGSGVMESFIYGVLMLGGNITMITPTGKFLGKNKNFFDVIKNLSGQLHITNKVDPTISTMDVLYVDEWWFHSPKFLQKKPPQKYRVDSTFLKNAKEDIMILHCLPAHHDREISHEVFNSPNSAVFEEAEFRVYSAMALLEYLSKG
ncbi:MAG: hypothetical protein COV59_03435 [Candidatus Magasanikbacteria bacterium CG11_big_fil_rev_8_21_14_0_20_39_34]|uniref:Ornithine carbamoyltransferase n=1 Tax=Candidatus Magasanikbacteria bacterium CG11_big_fil_rev_8_21_14_0_20_39_34 TaxID=1974653 RepID=A0A2H0N5N2_9BACT|nr:MAG: hypothetical protein COV59_03435 [Candidatus Magasanikbacteria bacterium CG11_big_fil_rev_8_21_14_0_20_39_34]